MKAALPFLASVLLLLVWPCPRTAHAVRIEFCEPDSTASVSMEVSASAGQNSKTANAQGTEIRFDRAIRADAYFGNAQATAASSTRVDVNNASPQDDEPMLFEFSFHQKCRGTPGYEDDDWWNITIPADFSSNLDAAGTLYWKILPSGEEKMGMPVTVECWFPYGASSNSSNMKYKHRVYDWELTMGDKTYGPYELSGGCPPCDWKVTFPGRDHNTETTAVIGDTIKLTYHIEADAHVDNPFQSSNYEDNPYGYSIRMQFYMAVWREPVLEIVDAKMVSPNELGIGITFDPTEEWPEEIAKKAKFWATINGTDVEAVFDVTPYAKSGGKFKVGLDANNDRLSPATPLRINLQEKGVPRFSTNQRFDLYGSAHCDDCNDPPPFPESKKEVTIPLPVVVLHGYMHKFDIWLYRKEYVGYPIPLPFLGAPISYGVAYKGFHDFLVTHGYQPEREWADFHRSDLIKHGYSTKEYKTLWDPHDFRGSMYTNPYKADPERIEKDLKRLLSIERDESGQFRGEIWNYAYAKKVNIVGHSFGGLVARYYASKHPDEVSQIITVGTPHRGVAFFYEIAFSRRSKDEFETEFKKYVNNGRSVLRWVIPTYQCTYLKGEDGKIEPLDPKTISDLFTNTFEGVPSNFSIFCGGYIPRNGKLVARYETKDQVILARTTNGWYRIETITSSPGDGYILADSARSSGFGIGPFQGEKHARLLADKGVQNNILVLLQGGFGDGKPPEPGGVYYFAGRLSSSEVEPHTAVFEPGASKAVLGINWKGSDLDLVLHDPNGREINSATPAIDANIEFIAGDNYEQYLIRDPVPGTWTMEVKAVDVPQEGEEYIAMAYSLTDQPLFADLDGDGEVSLNDLSVLGTHWRSQNCSELDSCSGADLDGDGSVGSADLSILAEYWLTETQ